MVGKLNNIDKIQALAAEWSQDPVVLQEFAAGDGWDIKLWVIDQHIFAARRLTPLEANASKEDFPIPQAELPPDWEHIALEIGRLFHFHLYVLDLPTTGPDPPILD